MYDLPNPTLLMPFRGPSGKVSWLRGSNRPIGVRRQHERNTAKIAKLTLTFTILVDRPNSHLGLGCGSNDASVCIAGDVENSLLVRPHSHCARR